jgi:CubicO group peptidase (beta-lactamase class C family)
MSASAAASVPIDGDCDPRFSAVREAFAACFRDEGERGAGVCAIVAGRCVVDLWGGFVDAAQTRRWQRDTLVNSYSVGKGILAMLTLGCAQAGELDLDAPVSSLWPRFGVEGKQRVSVRSLLAHRAGLPALRELVAEDAIYDWPLVCDALAGQEPYWVPDSAHGYHVNTWGFLVGEVLRRATGLAVGELLRERLSGPLDADHHFGLAHSQHHRVSPIFLPELPTDGAEHGAAFPPSGDSERDAMIRNAYFNPIGFSGFGTVNTRRWREASIPSTNGHGNARGIARLYAGFLAGDGRPGARVGQVLRREATRVHSDGQDRVLLRETRFGLGFQLARPNRNLGPSPHAFGHYGYGGALGLGDEEAGVAFGYVTNLPAPRFRHARTDRVLEALYAAL